MSLCGRLAFPALTDTPSDCWRHYRHTFTLCLLALFHQHCSAAGARGQFGFILHAYKAKKLKNKFPWQWLFKPAGLDPQTKQTSPLQNLSEQQITLAQKQKVDCSH